MDNSLTEVMNDWNLKVSAMPRIPRGDKGYIESLYFILGEVASNKDSNSIIEVSGSKSKATLDGLCIMLRPIKLVNQESRKEKWVLTEIGEEILSLRDDTKVAIYLNSKIKFFFEVIDFLREPRKTSEILAYANEKYEMIWKGKAQVHDRLQWLRDFGYIEFVEYQSHYKATEVGLELLKKVDTTSWQEIKKVEDETIEIQFEDFSSEIKELLPKNQEELISRKPQIGYIPGSSRYPFEVIKDYLEVMLNRASKESIIKFSYERYQIKDTSALHFLIHLAYAGLVERRGAETYETTGLGKHILYEDSLVELIALYHTKFLYIFEVLKELRLHSKTFAELKTLSYISYGFERENETEMRRRLSLLQAAKLVYVDRKEYHLSTLGRKVLDKVIVQDKEIDRAELLDKGNESYEIGKGISEFLSELKLSARDSMNPSKFEKALEEAFKLMGFSTEWLGGAGNTDVLIKAPTAPKFSYSVNVDGKTTHSGLVTSSAINFDSLSEHRKKHQSEFAIIVGIGFSEGDNTIRRAEKHKVGLLDVDTLIQMVKNHIVAPIPFETYRSFFEQVGIMKLDILEVERNIMLRRGELLKELLYCLNNESKDKITEGILNVRDCYQLIKNKNVFNSENKLEEIENMLEFLASPLIGCVGKEKDSYYAIGSLSDAVRKFEFYINQLK